VKRGLILGAFAGAMLFWLSTGWMPPRGAPAATAEDCVEVGLWSNDWHTSFALPAALLPPDHPLRRFDPAAAHFLVGWGDSKFYRSDGTDLALGLQALAPGGETVVHVIGASRPVEESFQPAQMTYVGLSRAGAAQLGEALAATLRLDPAGAVIPVGPGQHGERSRFLAARGGFDLFTVCNHWTARTLRRTGVGLNAAFLYRGDWLSDAAARAAPRCSALR
jgi:uncharacterized protein (TIGR02117 family)